ncbi:MAG: PAS domain-containing protein, partial [Dehalococcoidales bacterium]|nr:PAS domain-containing protein [Dehalococcoidales bacterium]
MEVKRKRKNCRSTKTEALSQLIHDKAANHIYWGNHEISEVLERISDGFQAIDRDWNFTYVNKRAASYLGLKPEDIIGQNIWKRFPQLIGTRHEFYLRKAVQEGEPQEYDIKGIITDHWYHVRVYP